MVPRWNLLTIGARPAKQSLRGVRTQVVDVVRLTLLPWHYRRRTAKNNTGLSALLSVLAVPEVPEFAEASEVFVFVRPRL